MTGTETALLAAAAAPGRTEIRHAACEPHVVELCEFLQAMGAGVEGGGSPTIKVDGCARLHGAERTLWGDYIEAGSWAVVARSPTAPSRSAARAPTTWKWSPRCSSG